MYKLYIDTSTKFLCIGITKDEKILFNYQEIAEKKQSELTIPVLEKALLSCNLQLKDIQEVCVTIGPGSFTGIRIGMCIAKTFASIHQIPLKAISSLNAYASNQPSIVLLDAKANRAYLGIYNQHQPILQECVLSLKKVQELIEKYANFDIILDGHLINKEDNIPQNIIQNMIDIAKVTPYVENVDALVPIYLKD